VKILLEGSEELRWLAVLLGPPLSSPEDEVEGAKGEQSKVTTA
jgi:hypothetical protein